MRSEPFFCCENADDCLRPCVNHPHYYPPELPAPSPSWAWFAGMIIALGAALMLAFLSAAPAHARWSGNREQADSKIVKWYHNQYNARGAWCCDNADGHPFYDDYKLNADGSVEFQYFGQHHRLPAYKVLKGPNPTGHAVWWWIKRFDGKHVDYCFATAGGM